MEPEGTTTTTATTLTSLPREIFWMVFKQLSPKDIICCRRVCKLWTEAFSSPLYLIPLLRRLFPRAREVRELDHETDTDEPPAGTEDSDHWRQLFDRVASRYDHLRRGQPQSVQKYRLCDDFGATGEREWFPIQPWETHASQLVQRVDCLFSESFWSYEEGLVVYPSADHACLVLLDLDTSRRFMVPFFIMGKVIRRIRLQRRVLVVEWAEPKAFHWLNDSDGVHRHFASSFDVTQSPATGTWSITFRNEWKIMFLGHPLSERDRFYSTHSKTHYAIYIWQPNRSLYTADDDAPIESLSVWDISRPSSYRPSLDPTGRLREETEDQGPPIVTRFGFRELGFYSVRQRGLPGVQCLSITEDDHSIEIVESRCPEPQVRRGPADWMTEVRVTTIPLVGDGPAWRRFVDVSLPPYRGNCSLQTAPVRSSPWNEPSYAIVSEAYDEQAQVGYSLYLSSIRWPFDMRMLLSIQTPTSTTRLTQDEAFELTGRGKIYGNERYIVGENGNRELVVFRFDR
ncbi:F-box protein [Aspergillus saccharolyticus JOP 1030-1]|uniref:F-box domain protein n=1 Tax=Aspergillus saccharolyticus JOP 1030-1 TaxID=1450539 RepID=A0A318ZTS1_9EURO|nr:F-box domain protein [Aspergillus saccharolyticus JOP 1030-1]PYH50045.1 F-box domain protein [Aspergillus saccharolyticus JOP 1030-1]